MKMKKEFCFKCKPKESFIDDIFKMFTANFNLNLQKKEKRKKRKIIMRITKETKLKK
jgi:hypothetical protein